MKVTAGADMDDETAAHSSDSTQHQELSSKTADDSFVAPGSPGTSSSSNAFSVEKPSGLRELHGRVVNNTNDKYVLPADRKEHGRLNVQHEMLKAAMGGLYVREAGPAVRRTLTSRKDGDPNAILDIGTGSGCWVLDMAEQYPHAKVVGMDLAPPNFTSPTPSNARFERNDANNGLSGYLPESFDVIHARCITIGITDYHSLIKNSYSVLRPGGALLTIECDLLIYGENQEPISAMNEIEPGFSWMNFVTKTAIQAVLNRNPNATAYLQTSKWIKEMGEIDRPWDDYGEKVIWIPVGPWTKELQGDCVNRHELMVARLAQEDYAGVAATLRPLLLSSGHPEETVDRWVREYEMEVREMKAKLYTKWICNWAVKQR